MKKYFIVAAAFFLLPLPVFAQVTGTAGMVTDASDIPLDQDNPSIAISRANRNTIVIGAVSDETDSLAMLAYYSSDRGASWQSSRLPRAANPNFFPGFDPSPSLAFDNSGNFYYAYTTNVVDDQGYLSDSSGDISFAMSSDGGKSWKNLTAVNINIQNYGFPSGAVITVDNSPASTHVGRIYVTWDQIYASIDTDLMIGGLYVAWSDNQGKTWSTPKKLTPFCDDYQEVKTGKHGEVYVSSSDSLFAHQLFISPKGDTSFTADPGNPISDFNHYPFFFAGKDTGLTGLKGASGFPAAPYVSFDVDLSSNRIHAVYGDYLDNVATLYYSYSDDGSIWSAPQEISAFSTEDRFFPSVSVDQITHEVSVLFLSSEADTKNSISIAPYRLRIGDASDTILSAQFNPLVVEASSGAPYIGDHTSSDSYDSVFAAAWTQNRTGYTDGDVFAYVSTGNAGATKSVPVVIHSLHAWLSAPYPNPSEGKNIFMSYYLPHAMHIAFSICDITGKEIRNFDDKTLGEGTYTEAFSLGNISPGIYFLKMVTEEGMLSQKVVVK